MIFVPLIIAGFLKNKKNAFLSIMGSILKLF